MVHKIYTGKEIAEIIQADFISNDPDSVRVKDILIDSRRLIHPENCMFFALVSKRNDGHKYVEKLYAAGLRIFVISKQAERCNSCPDAHFFVVDDTLEALQRISAAHRNSFQVPVVGITGSNGKTIVKEWLFQLLSKDKKIVRSPKSYNSQIGVPLSVWQMNTTHELAIFEAGISEPEEMQSLQTIINPSIGIFTNIGQAHDENFISTLQKVGEKLTLFTKVDQLIYSADHKELQEVIIRSGILENIKTFSWGKNEANDLQIISIDKQGKTTKIKAKLADEPLEIQIPFTDDASIENAIHCWCFMLMQSYSQELIRERMMGLNPIAMRLELKEGVNNCTIINDAYNSDFNSLSIAIDFLNQQNQHRDKVLILSDILQSGKNEVDLYDEVASLLRQKNITHFIGIGSAISKQRSCFDSNSFFYPNTEAFLRNHSFAGFSNQSILLKGARKFEFEQISRRLQQKAHETVLEINLDALINNLNTFRSRLKKGTKLMAMVKAFSYGSGGFEIANMLQFHQVDYLAVAYTDEGIELRKAGITLPIMVMSPEEHAFDSMIKHQLEPEIFSFRALNLLEKTIKRQAIPQNKPIKVHIKIDTGMHRLGFSEKEIPELTQRLQSNPMIYVQSVFSHLVGSDKPELDSFTHEQIERFDQMSDSIVKAFDHHILRHILNSSGILRFTDKTFDMVRLGIGLYGIGADPTQKQTLEQVTCLRSVLSQIRLVAAGDSVGYNRSFTATKNMRIGVVSVGYADGLMRHLGHGKLSLLVNGKAAPIVGDICMDMCMVDMEGIEAQEGDDVIVFDRNQPVSVLADAADTIPYEILSRISRRVKRVYYHE